MTASSPTLLLLAGLSLSLAGCGEKQRRVKDTGEMHECAEGWLADRGQCVPESCGTGPWGNLEVDDSTIHVDIEAAEGGDGSEYAPLRAIQAGLDLAGSRGGGLVAVAAGTYPETLELGTDHAGVHLAGRCQGLVTLDASVGDEDTAGIWLNTRYGEVELSGLRILGSGYVGVLVGSGVVRLHDMRLQESGDAAIGAFRADTMAPTSLALEGCELIGSTANGILAMDAGTQITLLDSEIRDTLPLGYVYMGYGIELWGGASLLAERCEVAGSAAMGVAVLDSGTEVTLVDTVVRDTLPDPDGDSGVGVAVSDGASFVARGCEFAGNTAAGVWARHEGTEVVLDDTLIRDTLPQGNGGAGYGIAAQLGVTLAARGCEVVRNTSMGIAAWDSATQITLAHSVVRDTRPDGGEEDGYGIQVSDGATLTAMGCALAGNIAAGMLLEEPGTEVTLRDTVIMDTQPNENGEAGYGILIGSGATLQADGCEVTGNRAQAIAAFHPGTRVTLRDSVLSETRSSYDLRGMVGLGLVAQEGASVVASGLRVRDNEGPGLYAVSRGSQLTCVGCTLLGNQFAGAAVVDGGVLVIEGSEIASTLPSPNLGGGVGVWAASQRDLAPPSLFIHNSAITDNQVAGIWLAGTGSYVLEGNRISDNTALPHGTTTRCGDGVYAAATESVSGVLALSGNTITANQGSGLFLDDGHAQLESNTFAGNAPDLWVQGDACLGFPDDGPKASTSEICPEWARPTCALEFSLSLTAADLVPARTLPPDSQPIHQPFTTCGSPTPSPMLEDSAPGR